MSSHYIRPSTCRKGWHLIALAGLLLAAQLLWQLHGLSHLDHDEQGDEVCALCIVGTNLDASSLDALPLALIHHRPTPLPTPPSHSAPAGQALTAYQGRAPPVFSSIV